VWSVFVSLFRFAPSLTLVVVFFLFYFAIALTLCSDHSVSTVNGPRAAVGGCSGADENGVVFEDTNGNGIRDEGEPGIEGVEVVITDSVGTTYTVTTDGNGEYMQTVAPGTVTIDIVDGSLPPGYVLTLGEDPSTVEVPVNGEATDLDGYRPPSPPTVNIVDTTLPRGYVQTSGDDPTTVQLPVNGKVTDLDGYQPPATNPPTLGPTTAGQPTSGGVPTPVDEPSAGGVAYTVTTDENGNYSQVVAPGATLINIVNSTGSCNEDDGDDGDDGISGAGVGGGGVGRDSAFPGGSHPMPSRRGVGMGGSVDKDIGNNDEDDGDDNGISGDGVGGCGVGRDGAFPGGSHQMQSRRGVGMGSSGNQDEDKAWASGSIEELEVFTNGLGLDLVKHRFRTIVETPKRRQTFLEEGEWKASPEFVALPYLWHRPNQGRTHYMADVIRVNNIVRKELGYSSIFAYIETRGWTITKTPGKKDQFTLQYRKLEEALAAAGHSPDVGTGKLTRNLHAMVESLYKTLHQEALKDPYTGELGLRFLMFDSFIQKLNQYAQDLQAAVMITKQFFLPHVTTQHEDVAFWMMKIFRNCRERKDLILFCQNLLSLLPNNQDNGKDSVCKVLLNDHADCIHDEVARRASSREHQQRYGVLVEEMLQHTFKRRTKRGAQQSMVRNLVMLRARVRDWSYDLLSPEEKESFTSST
jgi:hypothetical protein